MKYQIKNAAISIKGELLLHSINFEITENSHIGIVGKNGVGKTTLLKALISPETFEEGVEDTLFEINKIGNFSIGYLEQITFFNEDFTLQEEIENSFIEIKETEKKLAKLLKKMEENPSEKRIAAYTSLLEKYELLGGYTYKKEYETILHKFGFSHQDKEKRIADFSGGEKTKIAFIKLLLSKPDILLLDEPTNHLDIEAITWLENYLKNYKGAFVIVSHDRMFLNNTVNTIYDIFYGSVIKYVGNYESYEKLKKENYEKQLKDYEAQQKEIFRLKSIYEKFRNTPTKASMALSKLHAIQKMDLIDRPLNLNTKTFKINLKNMEPSGKNVISCRNLEIGYNRNLATFNFDIIKGEKVGIIGANGSGKSTLLKTLCGLLKPLSGSISFGYNVHVGYFDQNLKMINESHTILEEMKENFPDTLENELRSTLGAFLFSGEDVKKKINVLSGGEKMRLQLCKILYSKPNFLVLDEPTNHLDLEGKQQLENILYAYKGTILFVSHDRYFIKKLATKLIVFEENDISIYNFGYEEYKNRRKELEIETMSNNKTKPKKRKMKEKEEEQNIKRKLNKIGEEIKKLEEQRKQLTEELVKQEVYSDYKKSHQIKEEINRIQFLLDKLEKEWDELAQSLI